MMHTTIAAKQPDSFYTRAGHGRQRLYRYLRQGVMSVLCATLWGAAWAAVGGVSALNGDVSVLSATGQLKVPRVGENLEAGDVLTTGQGHVVLRLADQTLINLHPASQLVLEQVRANGDDKDALTLRLRWGAMRLSTGWIAQVAPQNYRLLYAGSTLQPSDKTIGATLDISAPQGGDALRAQGRSGAWRVSSAWGELGLRGNDGVRVAREPVAPSAFSVPPSGLIAPNDLDEAFTQALRSQEKTAREALQVRQNTVQADGGVGAGAAGAPANTASSGASAIPKACADGSDTMLAFGDFIKAYERGDPFYIQQRLEPSMLGYQTMLDGVRIATMQQRQVRMLVKDVTTQCASEVAIINFNWEKRYFDVLSAQPQMQLGRASVLLYLRDGLWRMSGITGDNPFVEASNAGAARIILSRNISVGGSISFATAAPALSRPVQLQVQDPKMAGRGSVTVRVVSGNGDVETITLPEIARGLFGVSFLTLQPSLTPIPGDGVVQVSNPATLSVQYVDQAPGGNRPATVLTARATLLP